MRKQRIDNHILKRKTIRKEKKGRMSQRETKRREMIIIKEKTVSTRNRAGVEDT